MRANGDFLGVLSKRRSGWLISAAVFFVTACLSALALAYLFAPTPPGETLEQPSPTADTDDVELSIGGTAFRIPANYILLPSARRGGALTDLSLAALLPNLQGYTLITAQDFEVNTPESRIITLQLKNTQLLPEGERLSRIYMSQVDSQSGAPGAYGLKQYAFRADSGYHDQDLFVGSTNQGPVVLLCTRPALASPAPTCLRDYPLHESLSLSYRFKRAQLEQWRMIDMEVRARIGMFTVRR